MWQCRESAAQLLLPNAATAAATCLSAEWRVEHQAWKACQARSATGQNTQVGYNTSLLLRTSACYHNVGLCCLAVLLAVQKHIATGQAASNEVHCERAEVHDSTTVEPRCWAGIAWRAAPLLMMM